MSNNFEKASRQKLRFNGQNRNGSLIVLSTEDLWDVSLEGLDTIARSLNKQLKDSSEESFIKTKTKENSLLELKFEVVKHIIEVKLAEKDAKSKAKETSAKREKLKELIEAKKDAALGEKSVEELEAEFAALGED